MKPKVSIVVPIYRAEKYLAQCVDSLLGQTLADIEVILVDDGSPDRCGKMADCYAGSDSRVTVIHQENAGLGAARNAGIRAASGEYIGFVDADDWVRPEMFQKLYHAAVEHDADIVVSGHCDVADGKVVVAKVHPLAGKTLRSPEEIMGMRRKLYGYGLRNEETEAFPMSVCMSLYRSSWLRENHLFFQDVYSEDTVFNLDAYRHARVITFTDAVDYCYRKEGQESKTYTITESVAAKFQEFLTVLAEKARQEADEACVLRAKKMAIDYCRLYVGMVDHSDIPFSKKRQYVAAYVQKDGMRCLWEGYPAEHLTFQQRLFHMAICKGHYGAALMMNGLRRAIQHKG